MKNNVTLILSIAFLLFFSCNKTADELNNLDYEAEFAIPVIKDAAISFSDLWQNNTPNQALLIQPDGNLVFRYDSDPVKVTTIDVLGALEFPIVAPITDTITYLPFELPADITIQEALISNGTVVFQFQPITDGFSEVTFTLPQISIGGKPLVIQTNGITGTTIPVNLFGYTFTPQNNELIIQYRAKDIAGNAIQLQNLGIFAKPRLKFVKGFWGKQAFQFAPSTILIDLYDERFLNGSIRFAAPTITATIESSFGVPIRSQIDLFKAQTKQGQVLPIDASAINGVDINYPLLTERGQSKQTILKIDESNSNIVDVFEAQLSSLEYGLTAIANPDNDSIISFIEDTSTFKAQVVVEVPVIGSTKHFTAFEKFEVPFENIEEIREGEFKLIVENELPLEANMQFYFEDQDGFIFDSLFQNSTLLVEAPTVNTEGMVITPIKSTNFVPVAAAQMQNIIKASFVRVKASFATSNKGTQDVQIRADQYINLKMGLKFKLN
jgi:hypothetical protein